jgi:hypothetical protein
MQARFGWRGACFGWAALHLLVALPLNARLPRLAAAVDAQGAVDAAPDAATVAPPPAHLAPLMATVFALMSMVGTSVATHLPTLLQASGATLAAAVAAGALMGPAQVAARVLELGWLRRRSPLWAARAAALGHPVAAALLLGLGAAAALPFVLLHGFGNGLLTIVRGTLPLAVFGAAGYGARQGWLSLPSRMLGALSPWLFGMALAQWGVAALWITGVLGLAACAGLALLKLPAR